MAGKLLPLTIFILLFSCMFYLKSYLRNIEHDNKYITTKFTEIDDTLGASFGKSEKLMPLNSSEKERYQLGNRFPIMIIYSSTCLETTLIHRDV